MDNNALTEEMNTAEVAPKKSVSFKRISPKKMIKSVGVFWFENYGIFFVIFFILMGVLSAFLMYQSVNMSGWTQEQKQAYISSKQQSVTFKKEQLDRIVENTIARQEFSKKDFEPISKIFDLP